MSDMKHGIMVHRLNNLFTIIKISIMSPDVILIIYSFINKKANIWQLTKSSLNIVPTLSFIRFVSIQQHSTITLTGNNVLREISLTLCEVLIYHVGKYIKYFYVNSFNGHIESMSKLTIRNLNKHVISLSVINFRFNSDCNIYDRCWYWYAMQATVWWLLQRGPSTIDSWGLL